MASDMVERVKLAIIVAFNLGVDIETELTDDEAGMLARAAIAAMREPTEAMTNRAWQLMGSNLRHEEVYRHMIDAALKVQTGEGHG